MAGSLELLDRAEAARERDRLGQARRRGIDRRPDRRRGGGHDGCPLRSSAKNLLSSALLTRPPKPSNLPSLAISVATLMKALIATRASEPPTLMRRTPIPARSLTVK